MAQGTNEDEGRDALARRAREEDDAQAGEHDRRGGDGGWERMRPDEPLAEGRQAAAEDNLAREGSGDAGATPGMTPAMEEGQRRSRLEE